MVKYLYIVKNAYLILDSFMLTFVLLTLVLVVVLIFIKGIKGKLILYNEMSCLVVKIFIE